MANVVAKAGDSVAAGVSRTHWLLDWLIANCRTVLLVGASFQVVVLLTLIASPLSTLITGQTVLLKAVPVDPRDLFRGDYVILRYEFSMVPAGAIPGLSPLTTRDAARDWVGKTIYVTLEKNAGDNHWHGGQFSLERPSTGTFIRGKLSGRRRIEFGIESFFVQEGRGREYEKAVREQKLFAEVALSDDGNAVLRRLVIE